MLGQLPAVLASDRAEQPTQIGQPPPAGLGAGEPTRDPGMQAIQPRRPRPHFLDLWCRPISVRHGPPPSLALGAAGTIPAGGQGPYLTSSQVRLEY